MGIWSFILTRDYFYDLIEGCENLAYKVSDNFGGEAISQWGRRVGGMVSKKSIFLFSFFIFLFNFYFYPPNPPNICFMRRKY
jgi:hypothetical protein